MGFSRQEYWSGLPFPSPRDLPDPGIKPRSPTLWDFPGKNTGMGCHFLLQVISLTQGSNPGLPHCRQTLYCLSHQGRPERVTVLGNCMRVLSTWGFWYLWGSWNQPPRETEGQLYLKDCCWINCRWDSSKKPKVEIIDLTFQNWCMQERSTREPICERKILGPTPRKIDKQRCIYIYTHTHTYKYIYTHTYMHTYMGYMCDILIIVLLYSFFNY